MMLSLAPIECPEYLLRLAAGLSAVDTAIVNAGTPLILESTRLAAEQGLITPVLVGEIARINTLARDINWDISGIRQVPAASATAAAEVAVSLARHGEVASLMKGHLHTDELLRAVINRRHGVTTRSRLSHVFHMTIPGSAKVICITDAVMRVLPSVSLKLAIARNAVSLLHALGNQEPRVAVLSATEDATSAIPSSLDAATITREAANGAVPGAMVYGPLAFDNAVSVEAARVKGIQNPVAGNADVLLVPNIETGNALFKQMVYFMGAAAAGIVIGAKVPIVLTSRADPPAARLAAAALATIYASHLKTPHT